MKWTILTLSLLTLASCQGKDSTLDPQLEGFFPGDTGEVRKVDQFIQVSAASGARADAMLSKQHFDGGKLNSLGEQKLSLMLQDDDSIEPLVVYLNINEQDAASKARKASVVTFLKDKGLTDAQMSLVYGDNPGSRSPAGAHLSKLAKTETGETAAGGAASSSAAPAGGTGEQGGGAAASIK